MNDNIKTMKNKKKESSHFYAALSSGVSDFAKEMRSIPANKNKPVGDMVKIKNMSQETRVFDPSKRA